MVSKKTVYQCQGCGQDHDTEDEALECCPPEERTVFECKTCKETFVFEQNAVDCEKQHLLDDRKKKR